jgi:glutathione S-transferase
MKLYFSPGTCSLASHIALREAGLPFDLVKVDIRAKKTADGGDYTLINPKGYVPALQFDSGEVLTEGPTTLQYIADLKPEAKLAPPAGTMERYRLQEWLGFINSEVHKAYSILFNPDSPEDFKTATRKRLGTRYAWIEQSLGSKPYLMGETFSIADAYLYTVSTWAKRHAIDLSQWPAVKAFVDRVAARPHVKEALLAEGIGANSSRVK